MNVLNILGSVPTSSTMGVVLCVVLYTISVGISSMVVWNNTNCKSWR